MLIKMVNSKKIKGVQQQGHVYLCFNLICFVVCIHDNMTIIHIFCDNMTLYTGSFVSSRSLTNIYTYSTKEVLAGGV